MERPKVHFVVETGSLAGGVRVIGEYANRLLLRGWPVEIWSINARETLSKWFPLDERIPWRNFETAQLAADYDQLAVTLKKHPGFKIATFWKTSYAVKYAAAESEGLYLVQDIESVYECGPKAIDKVLQTYAQGLRHVTTSHWVERQMQADPQLHGATYIGLGIDSKFFAPIKGKVRSEHPLACARRQVLKGWPELVEVAHYLAHAGHELTTYGLDERLMLECKIRHVPYPSDQALKEMYNWAACFIATSRHEGLSLTPLEAMATGCPVVMTSADGNLEYAQHGVNCILAETPEAIASEVLDLIVRPERGQAMADAARKTAQRYQWTQAVDRLEAVLEGRL